MKVALLTYSDDREFFDTMDADFAVANLTPEFVNLVLERIGILADLRKYDTSLQAMTYVSDAFDYYRCCPIVDMEYLKSDNEDFFVLPDDLVIPEEKERYTLGKMVVSHNGISFHAYIQASQDSQHFVYTAELSKAFLEKALTDPTVQVPVGPHLSTWQDRVGQTV